MTTQSLYKPLQMDSAINLSRCGKAGLKTAVSSLVGDFNIFIVKNCMAH